MQVVVHACHNKRLLTVDGRRLPRADVSPGEHPTEVVRATLATMGLTAAEPPDLLCILPNSDGFEALYACLVEDEEPEGHWVDPEQIPSPGIDAFIAWHKQRKFDEQIRLWRLTCDMFVVRDGRMLILQRAGKTGGGIWYIPGGIAEPREDPLNAAVRETHEETGLLVEDPELLRVWSYIGLHDLDAIHATYVGWSSSGDVVISGEHSAYDWVEPQAFLEGYWADLGAEHPDATFVPEVRKNVELLIDQLDPRPAEQIRR